MLIGTVIVDTWVKCGNDSLEKFEDLSVWYGEISTSVIIVGLEEFEAVDTVVRAVGDVFIVSVGVIEVGETMVGKDVGKGKAIAVGEIISIFFCCETCTFWEHFFKCNVIYISDIQWVLFVRIVKIMPFETVYHFYYSLLLKQ